MGREENGKHQQYVTLFRYEICDICHLWFVSLRGQNPGSKRDDV